jgi:hypothetical protein
MVPSATYCILAKAPGTVSDYPGRLAAGQFECDEFD